MSSKIPLLALCSLSDAHAAELAARFELHHAADAASRRDAVARLGGGFRAVLTIGTIGLTAAEIAAMPKLELVCALGVGYENIDVPACRQRGITVANGADTNADCVADHAIGLLIAAVRGLVRLDRQCREGVWRDKILPPANVSGRRLGILGLGGIGERIARRAAAFDLAVGYHNRRAREGSAHRHFGSLIELAQWADFLVVATPGGADTRHLVDARTIDALGPRGVLVNIARGSVVDTSALAAALRDGRLGAAGLDVYESEPIPPAELIALDNVVLSPHVAGWSPESIDASVARFIANAEGHFAGRGVISPV